MVRPAIVESSWLHPYPGWIEGFKMAEPLILAYGRGELPEFPASPDSVVDIVPCDHVVNAILAVCATKPTIGRPEFYHVSSGARNPLTFNELYGQIREYFLEHPFEGGPRGAARLPQWQFPGAASVERLLATSERAHTVADRLLDAAPRSARTRKFANDLDRTRGRLELPAPLPLALQRVRPVRAALRRRQHARADRVAARRRPADLRLRHRRLRLEDLHPGRALPLGHRAGAPDGRAAAPARQPADHHEGPEPGHRRRDRGGRLRPGRHDHVHQRDRAVPVVPAAGAVRPRGRSPSSARCCRSCRPTCGPSGATAAPSCARSTAATPAPTSPPWSSSSTPSSRRPSSAGCRPTPVAGSASTAPPVTPPS